MISLDGEVQVKEKAVFVQLSVRYGENQYITVKCY